MSVTQLRSCTAVFLLLICSLAANAEQQKGSVMSGQRAIAGSTVTLYQAGTTRGGAAVSLGSAVTDQHGAFTISYTAPSGSPTLYLIADGATGRNGQGVRLATVTGTGQNGGVVINERTTVATAYAMAQFISGVNIAGSSPGVPNAALTLRNLVNVSTGAVGAVLGTSPNGPLTSTMREFNSLANILSVCVHATTKAPCTALFQIATAEGAVPTNTLDAAVNIAHYPASHVSALFLAAAYSPLYSPMLDQAPDVWTIAIRYHGNGRELDGPGNMVFDKDGNIWSTNNYVYNKSPFTPVCGGNYIIKLTPDGQDAPGAPYFGGGLYGAGFGIAMDANENVWVGNFGFQGKGLDISTCENAKSSEKTVSEFASDGTPLSGHGFSDGGITQPQGMATDQQGNLWIANCGANNVTEYPAANHSNPLTFGAGFGIVKPFGLAVDGNGNIWVANNGGASVTGIRPDGTKLAVVSGHGISRPLGIAVDSQNNVWVANSGILPVPCGTGETTGPTVALSITKISADGSGYSATTYHGGGLFLPWGIAVDGNDNVWVSNFGSRRLSEFCGSRPENCPAGKTTGDPISPPGGYSSDALTRNTGVVIDPSGNVWLANNWLEASFQANPGGHALVVFIGLAAPVKTPMAGPPQQP